MADVLHENIVLTGIVQGVGFRPFVTITARQMGIAGWVFNAGGQVEVYAKAEPETLERFIDALRDSGLSGARVDTVRRERIESFDADGFTIAESTCTQLFSSELTIDLPICRSCAAELLDPNNRRYRYPLISCASCGPRFSILEKLPYDRPNTAMKGFALCPSCQAEYSNPQDRRFHAQTISCHDCGPQVSFTQGDAVLTGYAAVEKAAELLNDGKLVAVKGIGGYHIGCLPSCEPALKRLRTVKGREEKPFAVLFSDIQELEQYCAVSQTEHELLLSAARPIVLIDTVSDPFVSEVSRGSLQLGCFLAYTPLQILLLGLTGPLVMTSLNRSDSPIIIDDAEALAFQGIDGVLAHDRPILRPLDDSVLQVVCGSPRTIRRSRGLTPESLYLGGGREVLALGGDLKSSFCTLKDGRATLSAPYGDLDDMAVRGAYLDGIAHMLSLTNFTPEIVACDMHPRYISAEIAAGYGLPVIQIQHHHAHTAAVMAEHGLNSTVIGVAFDGVGYGTDGTIWGGEILLCDRKTFSRFSHLPTVTMTGGDSAAKNARSTLDCYLHGAGLSHLTTQGEVLRKALEMSVNTVVSTSAGRLFDAVASWLDICHENRYEGQCAIELERAATRAFRRGDTPPCLSISRLWHDLEALKGTDRELLALAFHRSLACWTAEACACAREQSGVNTVALSGGVFQNALLLRMVLDMLRHDKFEVFYGQRYPSGDASLALGQTYIASYKGEV